MQVTCPHCQTIFKVSNEHLQVADGYVRCGICKEVFNALEKTQPKAKIEADKRPTSQTKDSTPTEKPATKNVESENSDSVEYVLEQSSEVSTTEGKDNLSVSKDFSDTKEETSTTETADSDHNTQADLFSTSSKIKTSEPEPVSTAATTIKADKTEPIEQSITPNKVNNDTSDDIANHASAPSSVSITATASITPPPTTTESDNSNIDNSLFDGVQSKLIPDEYRIPELHNTYTVGQDLVWSLAILLFTASLFAQYLWFNRNELISDPQLRPLVIEFCKTIHCDTLELREPDKIEMTARNIYSHPNIKKALMISGTLINHAEFDQPYPNILIDFSNVRGEVIASRTFSPENYLQIKNSNLKPLSPRDSVDFNMEIKDPGKDAMTYEFSFL